jgi:beta-lactamase class A
MISLIQLTFLILLHLVSSQASVSNTDLLRKRIGQIVSDKDAIVGVSIIGNNGKDMLSLNGNKRFPKQSVFKFHWENMFQNWTTPNTASETLKLFYEKISNLLSKASYEFFWETMKETTTGKNRTERLLTIETMVGHKSGWSVINKETGITAALNDVVIVFLPNDEHFILSIFITESRENFDTTEKIIAGIAKTAYDFYTN